MSKQIILHQKDFPEIWTLIIEGYNFWNNINRRRLSFVSGSKAQMKQFIKIILPRAVEVLNDFPADKQLLKEINKLESLLQF